MPWRTPPTSRGAQAFLEYATEDTIARIRRQAFSDLDYELLNRVPRPIPQRVKPTDLLQYLHGCRNVLEELVTERIAGYSSCRWLYYLRRLPDLCFPSYQGGLDLYKVALCEALTGQNASVPADPDPLNYPVNEPVIVRALRFSQQVLYLVNIHVALQQAAKGVPFVFADSAIPVPRPSPETSEALSLFDRRVDLFDQRPLERLGTEVHEPGSMGRVNRLFAQIPRRKAACWMREANSPANEEPSEFLAHYGFNLVDLTQLGQLVGDQRISSPLHSEEAGPLLMILRIAAEMSSNSNFRRVFLESGYATLTTSTFDEITSALFSSARNAVQGTIPELCLPQNKEMLFLQLTEMHSSLWPVLPGPIVRRCGDFLYLDLASATMRLNHAFQFPRVTGLQANARAEYFEMSVQAVLDRSRWADPETRSLRGRTLRYMGKRITDIDAIGSREGALLLVSCKSVLYSEYDTADYRVLTNAADVVQKAVQAWHQACTFLRQNPTGDNYDFSAYHSIIGVVCTPVVIYLPLGPATARVADGLFAAVSISELRLWLGGVRLETAI